MEALGEGTHLAQDIEGDDPPELRQQGGQEEEEKQPGYTQVRRR